MYPLLSYEVYGHEYRWQFANFLSFAGSVAGGSGLKRSVSPSIRLYFQQRSADTNENYTAVVPFYGHIKNRLMINDVCFVMFPLYSETRKKDVVTDNYLYPVFRPPPRRSPDRLAIMAARGSEHKYISKTTNGFGDVSVESRT